MLMEVLVDSVTQETTTVSTTRSVFYFPLLLHACSGDLVNMVPGEVTCHGRFHIWESGESTLVVTDVSYHSLWVHTWRERRPFLSDCI